MHEGVCVFVFYDLSYFKTRILSVFAEFSQTIASEKLPFGRGAHVSFDSSLSDMCFMCQRNKMKSHLPVLSSVSRVPGREVSSFPIRHLIIACNGDCKVFKCIIRTHESVGGPLLLFTEVPYCLYAVLNQYLTKS